MEVRFESMVCLWDDKIPTMYGPGIQMYKRV